MTRISPAPKPASLYELNEAEETFLKLMNEEISMGAICFNSIGYTNGRGINACCSAYQKAANIGARRVIRLLRSSRLVRNNIGLYTKKDLEETP